MSVGYSHFKIFTLSLSLAGPSRAVRGPWDVIYFLKGMTIALIIDQQLSDCIFYSVFSKCTRLNKCNAMDLLKIWCIAVHYVEWGVTKLPEKYSVIRLSKISEKWSAEHSTAVLKSSMK